MVKIKKEITHKCRKCGLYYFEEEFYPSQLKRGNIICKTCNRELLSKYEGKKYKDLSEKQKRKKKEYIKRYNRKMYKLYNEPLTDIEKKYVRDNMVNAKDIFKKLWNEIIRD